MARPAKLKPEVAQRILTAIAGGNTREVAAGYAGVSERSLYRWIEAGKAASRGTFWQFWQDVQKAESDAVVESVATIRLASRKSWQAAAWWLERKYPDQWALRQPSIERQLDDEADRLAKEYGLDPDELKANAAKLLKFGG